MFIACALSELWAFLLSAPNYSLYVSVYSSQDQSFIHPKINSQNTCALFFFKDKEACAVFKTSKDPQSKRAIQGMTFHLYKALSHTS